MPTYESPKKTGPGPGWPGDPWSEPWNEERLGSTLESLFDELGEREELEALTLAKRYPWARNIIARFDETDVARRGGMRRALWPAGPWDSEPDLIEWRHRTGLPCLIVRSPVTGALCGYVGVPATHRYFEREYQALDDAIEVHGGLTFSGECGGHICHVPEPGEPRDIWWLGFDCAHAWDLAPGMEAMRQSYSMPSLRAREAELLTSQDKYWGVLCVRAETEELAEQLAQGAQDGRWSREGWWWPLWAGARRLALRELPGFFRSHYLERDTWGRGPEEQAAMRAEFGEGLSGQGYGSLERVAQARRRDQPLGFLKREQE